jgi:hypothetical protein
VALSSAVAVVMCRTRSAWLAAGALVVLGAFFAARKGAPARRRAVVLAAVLGAGAALGPVLGAGLPWSTGTPYRDTLARLVSPSSHSASGRLVQYATTLRMAAAHPLLGVGPGNWAGQYPAFAGPKDPTVSDGPWPTPRLPNSDVVGLLAEHGALWFALALGLGWALLREGGPRAPLRRATLLALAVVCALDAVLTVPGPLLLAAWVLGASGEPGEAVARRAAPRRWAVAGVAVAVVLLAGASVLAARRLMAFDAWAQDRQLESLERAVRLDGGDTAARLVLAANLVAMQRCSEALPHLQALARQVPVWPAAEVLRESCR